MTSSPRRGRNASEPAIRTEDCQEISSEIDDNCRPPRYRFPVTSDKRIIVVGAGIGGIAAAMLLSARGNEVDGSRKGKRHRRQMWSVDVAGRAIDCGPTVVTMREVFEEVFDALRPVPRRIRDDAKGEGPGPARLVR